MKKLILSFLIMINSLLLMSCISTEEIAYHDEYVVGTSSYPVYYINSYPYYWFDNTWIMIPTYRYTYIRHISVPRYIHAYRPNPHHYMHRPNPHYRYGRVPGDYRSYRPHSGVPHTRQPNVNRPQNHHNGNGNRQFGSRR